VAGDRSLDVNVLFKPRNTTLLRHIVDEPSAKRPRLSPLQVKRLFLPTPDQLSAMRAYLRSAGVHSDGNHGLALDAHGSAAAVQRAFHTTLRAGSNARGDFVTHRSALRLPADLAPLVRTVGGIDGSPVTPVAAAGHHVIRGAAATGPRIVGHPSVHRSQPTTTTAHMRPSDVGDAPTACPDMQAAEESVSDSNQPVTSDRLASQYDLSRYWNGSITADNGRSYLGQDHSIAYLEFTGFDLQDVADFAGCVGSTQSTTLTQKTYSWQDGDSPGDSGAIEAVLDGEVSLMAAPQLSNEVFYDAPGADMPDTGYADLVDNVVGDDSTYHFSAISISWGTCEPAVDSAAFAAESDAFDTAVADGITPLAATGDDGSDGCRPTTGQDGLAVWDPASQPDVTAVGGTSVAPNGSEGAWGRTSPEQGGGGGISEQWPMPTWQADNGGVMADSSATPCGASSGSYCREVPDIALDSDPNVSPYPIYCPNVGADCAADTAEATSGWSLMGGTSAATPLFAAIASLADEYSTAHEGAVLGGANPDLYPWSKDDPSLFRDITTGTNDAAGLGGYNAASGFDLTTGLGAPLGGQLGWDLMTATDGTYCSGSPPASTTVSSSQFYWQDAPEISWTPVTESGESIVGYEIYRDGNYLDEVDGSTTSYTDDMIDAGHHDSASEALDDGYHSYDVYAVDSCGQTASYSSGTDIDLDTLSPDTPSAVITAHPVTKTKPCFSWPAVSDNDYGSGVDYYIVYRNGSYLGDTKNITNLSKGVCDKTLTATDGSQDGVYSYQVFSVDYAGNTSGLSPAASITYDTQAPAKPSLSVQTPTIVAPFLSFSSTDALSGIDTWAISRDGQQIASIPGGNTGWSDTSATPGNTYTYTVQAVDAAGNKSPQSATYAVVYNVSRPTKITASPTQDETIDYGKSVTISGTIKQKVGGQWAGFKAPLELDLMYSDTGSSQTVTSDSSGKFSVTLGPKQLDRAVYWYVSFNGDDQRASSYAGDLLVDVTPQLSASATTTSGGKLASSKGSFVVDHGQKFEFTLAATPNMKGENVVAQYKGAKATSWSNGPGARISGSSTARKPFTFSKAGSYEMRWKYTPPSSSQQMMANWSAATSNVVDFTIR
jgi:hypothetical protein